MSPHEYSINQTDVGHETSIITETQKEELKQFTEHCRIFYSNALSLKQTSSFQKNASSINDEEFGMPHLEEDREAVSKGVVQAFEQICASRTSFSCEHESHRSAIIQCGLQDTKFLLGDQGKNRLREYTRARDAERLRAHKILMEERKNLFLTLLETRENDNDESDMTFYQSSSFFQKWGKEGCTRKMVYEFSNSYKSKIGVHPFLAGLRNLLATQLKNPDCIVRWDFDIATITENCNEDDSLMHDTLAILFALLTRVPGLEKSEEKKEESTDRCSTIWELRDVVSNQLMRRILHVLPPGRELHAKPTGTLTIVNEKREISPDLISVENLCVVL